MYGTFTVVVCAITSNLKRAGVPDNVRIEKGEAGLPKECVVNISQLFMVDKADLSEKVGTFTSKRLEEILAGIQLLLEPRAVKE